MYIFVMMRSVTPQILSSTNGATTKIFYFLPFFSQLYSSCTLFVDFIFRFFIVRHTVPPSLRIIYRFFSFRSNQFSQKNDSCWYWSDCVSNVNPVSDILLRSNHRNVIRVASLLSVPATTKCFVLVNVLSVETITK